MRRTIFFFYTKNKKRGIHHSPTHGRIVADTAVISCSTSVSLPSTSQFSPQLHPLTHSQRQLEVDQHLASGGVSVAARGFRDQRGGSVRRRHSEKKMGRLTSTCEGRKHSIEAMSSGTSASKRPERFHGAFTGGFSAGFFNSVSDTGDQLHRLLNSSQSSSNLVLYFCKLLLQASSSNSAMCFNLLKRPSLSRLELRKDGLPPIFLLLGTNGHRRENSGPRTLWMTRMGSSLRNCRSVNFECIV